MTVRVLVACEESQAVTVELRALGIEASSCATAVLIAVAMTGGRLP